MDGTDESVVGAAEERADGSFRRFLRSLWRRMAGPAPTLDLCDIVAPEALPVCPACLERHHPLARRCPTCGEAVGSFGAWVYPDMIWIWGRGLWRLMERKRVSRLVWVGMVLLGFGWLGDAIGRPLLYYDRDLGWLALPIAYAGMVSVVISFGAGVRMLVKAWRLRGRWRG